jgi:RNA polymerase sigma-70 factor (family 1)
MPNYKTLNDQELAILLKQDHEGAFAALYQRFGQRIYTNLRNLLKDESLAEEFLQDVFMKVWEKREQLNYEISFRAYLFRISENLVRDFFRKAARDQQLINKLIKASTEFSADLQDDYILKEEKNLFSNAIESLPPKRKKIYTLCKIEGRSYDEVSQLLGISNTTINDHIVKATKSIQKHITLSSEVAITLIAACIIKL